MKPRPWPVDRKATLGVLKTITFTQPFHVAWISDGLDYGDAQDFAEQLQKFGTVELFRDQPDDLPAAISKVETSEDGFDIDVARPDSSLPRFASLVALDENGRLLGRVNLTSKPFEGSAKDRLEIPVELRNRAAQGSRSTARKRRAASCCWTTGSYRRKVGLVGANDSSTNQPLLTDTLLYREGRKALRGRSARARSRTFSTPMSTSSS